MCVCIIFKIPPTDAVIVSGIVNLFSLWLNKQYTYTYTTLYVRIYCNSNYFLHIPVQPIRDFN